MIKPEKMETPCTGETTSIHLTNLEAKRLRQITLLLSTAQQKLDWFKTRRNRAHFEAHRTEVERLSKEAFEIISHATWRELDAEIGCNEPEVEHTFDKKGHWEHGHGPTA